MELSTADAGTRSVPELEAEAPGWSAELELELRRSAERTVIERRRHRGPLLVQRPFYPEANGCCHVYVIHPPGGVVGGDDLSLSVALGPGASALLTTPAATKLYRSDGRRAELRQTLAAASDAALEWLPQETIAFSGCRARLVTRVELEADAAFIGWEILCLGRRAAGEAFAAGCVEQRLEVWRARRPVIVERLSVAGSGLVQRAAWGLQGRAVVGTLVAVGPGDGAVLALRAALEAQRGAFAATALEGAVVCRYLGDSGAEARDLFGRAWEILRPLVLGRGAVPPRIWST